MNNLSKTNSQLCRVPGAHKKAHLGNIYIMSDDSAVESELMKVVGQSASGMFYVPYSPVFIKDVCDVSDNVLAKTARSLGANVFTQVFMPDQDVPVFLFETGDNATLGITAIEMLYAAEGIAKESVCNAIKNYALNDPDKCSKWLSSPDDEKDISFYKSDAFDRGSITGSSFKGVSDYSTCVSPSQAAIMKQFNEARENFVRYVQELHSGKSEESEEAEKLIDWVLKELSEREKAKILKLYLKEMASDELEDFFNSFIDVSGIPTRSKIKLSIEKSDDCINNDGFYRLYYQFADFEKRPLHFKHKSSCIVYLMLLICRKKDLEGNFIFTFEKNNVPDKTMFVKLMTTVYDKTDMEAVQDYYNLFTDADGNQGRLKDYIKDCTELFDLAVSKYESPYPFMPKKIGSSGKVFALPILPDNIIFSDSFTQYFPL